VRENEEMTKSGITTGVGGLMINVKHGPEGTEMVTKGGVQAAGGGGGTHERNRECARNESAGGQGRNQMRKKEQDKTETMFIARR